MPFINFKEHNSHALKNFTFILPIVAVLGYGMVGFIDDYKNVRNNQNDLHLKELKKTMATYSIKRFSKISQREYGMGDVVESIGNGVRDAAGTAIETGGKLLDNGVTKTVAGIAGLGSMGTGASVGASIGSVLGPLGTIGGGLLGALATPFLAAKATGVAGQALKSIGQDIHT